jgi:hypothetical protein
MTYVPIEVDCSFALDGDVRIRRVRLHERWQHVDQGRQWHDAHGRHLLVMMLGGHIHELVLRPDSLRWELSAEPSGGRRAIV